MEDWKSRDGDEAMRQRGVPRHAPFDKLSLSQIVDYMRLTEEFEMSIVGALFLTECRRGIIVQV